MNLTIVQQALSFKEHHCTIRNCLWQSLA